MIHPFFPQTPAERKELSLHMDDSEWMTISRIENLWRWSLTLAQSRHSQKAAGRLFCGDQRFDRVSRSRCRFISYARLIVNLALAV